MKHTYFYDTMDWKAKGTYYSGDGAQFPLYGEVSIVHDDSYSTLGGFLEVQSDTPARFTNDYAIRSSDLETTLLWESYNPALGTLKGRFEIVGDSIISHYTSEDGVYSGTETLVQRNAGEYYTQACPSATASKCRPGRQ